MVVVSVSRLPCGRREDPPLKPPAVLVNARAGRVRRDPGLVDRLRSIIPGENLRIPQSIDEVGEALTALCATPW